MMIALTFLLTMATAMQRSGSFDLDALADDFFSTSDDPPAAPAADMPAESSAESVDCVICQESLPPLSDTRMRVFLGCDHQHDLHQNCAKQWFERVRSRGATPSCPCCRAQVPHATTAQVLNIPVERLAGEPTRFLDDEELEEIVPVLAREILGDSYNPETERAILARLRRNQRVQRMLQETQDDGGDTGDILSGVGRLLDAELASAFPEGSRAQQAASAGQAIQGMLQGMTPMIEQLQTQFQGQNPEDVDPNQVVDQSLNAVMGMIPALAGAFGASATDMPNAAQMAGLRQQMGTMIHAQVDAMQAAQAGNVDMAGLAAMMQGVGGSGVGAPSAAPVQIDDVTESEPPREPQTFERLEREMLPALRDTLIQLIDPDNQMETATRQKTLAHFEGEVLQVMVGEMRTNLADAGINDTSLGELSPSEWNDTVQGIQEGIQEGITEIDADTLAQWRFIASLLGDIESIGNASNAEADDVSDSGAGK